MQCPQCQGENRDTAKFCEACGRKLARVCPSCGQEVSLRAKFCPECGSGLTASALPPNLRQPDHQQARSSDSTASLVRAPAQRGAPEAEHRQLTVLFCDLVDSTALAGRLDPEEWREVVRAYQAACAEVIGRYEGHIAQYLGDGLLVYFGYPQAHEDDAQRAVRTGLVMVEAIGKLNAQLQQDIDIQLAVRVGIHTGLVVVGEVGGSGRQEQLALGDTPNIAARLQGLAAPDTVVLSPATRRLVEAYFTYAELGPQALKGVATPLAVIDKGGERCDEPELYRIKGELLLRQTVADASQAETCFQQALTVSRQQQAKSWELRATVSLGRLWQKQGKRAEARELLAPIYGWFTEGFDTADLQEAKALLEALS